ncbi:hypothetical protein [Auritidibacter ignavus]|uniref:hypothetical protein n=1 Tax=Auritidibacter ignavus TaxID=678932 RepID=UPI00109C53B2|nr:hypothetical protein [Auritidibacter ignavus]
MAEPGEFTGWLRLDPHHPRRYLDGLDGACLMLPEPIQRIARLLRTRWADSLAPAVATLSRATAHLPRCAGKPQAGTPVLFCDPAQTPAEIIVAGRRLMRLWLSLRRSGLCVAPATEMIDAPRVEKAVTSWVQRHTSPEGTRPLSYFWVGIPAETPPRSARLTGR